MALLNFRPPNEWAAAACAALQPQLLALPPAQVCNALWALANFRYSPEPGWCSLAVQALYLSLPHLAPHQLAYGLGSLQVSSAACACAARFACTQVCLCTHLCAG